MLRKPWTIQLFGPFDTVLLHEGITLPLYPVTRGLTRQNGALLLEAHRRVHGAQKENRVIRASRFLDQFDVLLSAFDAPRDRGVHVQNPGHVVADSPACRDGDGSACALSLSCA